MWGHRRTPMLQQEQDWREIPDRQMLLLPWTGGGNDKSGTIVCRRYAWRLSMLLIFPFFISGTWCKRMQNLPHLLLFLWQGLLYRVGWGMEVERFQIFMGPKGFGSFKIESPTTSLFRGCSRSCSELKRQKAGSFNITSKTTLVTGELIPVFSFHCNGSDRGFLVIWLFFPLPLTFGKCQGELFLPKVSSEQLKTLTPVLSPLLLHPNILHSGLTLNHTL